MCSQPTHLLLPGASYVADVWQGEAGSLRERPRGGHLHGAACVPDGREVSALLSRGHAHMHDLPDVAVRVLEGAAVHGALVHGLA